MTRKAENLLAAALELPQTERAALASALLRSLDEDDGAEVDQADIEAAWAEELRRRADDLRAGRVTSLPWEQVKADLEARIRRES
jgi:putative addiction module component (TIGR02574 family)